MLQLEFLDNDGHFPCFSCTSPTYPDKTEDGYLNYSVFSLLFFAWGLFAVGKMEYARLGIMCILRSNETGILVRYLAKTTI